MRQNGMRRVGLAHNRYIFQNLLLKEMLSSPYKV